MTTTEIQTAAPSSRVSRRMGEEASRGEWVGRIPLGYLAPRYAGGSIEIDTGRATLVRLAFDRASSSRCSLRDVHRDIAALGLVTHSGKRICLSSLHHMLANPFYAGLVRYKGELYQGRHIPLVSRELFDRVQGNLAARRCA